MSDHTRQTSDPAGQVPDLPQQSNLNLGSFKYTPIEPGWIRILDLISKSDQPLQCRLRHVRLHSPEANYTALSYVWGDISKPFSMEVLDTTLDHGRSPTVKGTIFLTASLHDALRDLRDCLEIQSKTFWIDQICINQDDVSERNHQVAQMGKVFECATQVVTYLGPREAQDDIALDLLMRIWKHFEPLTKSTALAELNEHNHRRYIRDTISPPGFHFPENLWQCESLDVFLHLSHVISGPWTERVWLVQENVVNANTKFLRGCRFTSWGPIRLVCLLSCIGLVPRVRSDNILALLRRREAWKYRASKTSVQSPLKLRRLLGMAAWLRCWDPKDRIYAVLGLANDAGELGIAPDYAKSTVQTLTNVAVAFVRRDLLTRTRALFHLVWSSRGKSSDPALPSWVPAYTDSGYYRSYMVGNASETNARAAALRLANTVHFESSSSLENCILVTKGLRLDFELEECLGTMPPRPLIDTLDAVELTQVLCLFENVRQFHASRVLDTLSMGRLREIAEPAAAEAVAGILDLLRRATSGDRIENQGNPGQFFLRTSSLPGGVDSAAYHLLKQQEYGCRSVWMANNQRLCLTPNRAHRGDIAVVLFGGDWVYFLRPSGDKFEYIGWGYVAGCMHGEPFEVDDWEDNVETFKLI